MLDKLKALFVEEEQDERIDPALAAAALLYEVAWADHQVSDSEIETLANAVQKQFSVAPERLRIILEESKQVHDSSVGVFPYTRAINEQLDQAAKIDIIKAMWQIAYVQDDLDVFEEHTIRRIADLLYVSHQDFIGTKLAVKRNR